MYYDSHTHTNNSHDSQCPIDEMCISAIKKNMSAISITDHADIPEWFKYNIEERIRSSYRQAKKASETYDGKLEILTGVELGEMHLNSSYADALLLEMDFDVVLGSLHILKDGMDFCTRDFSKYTETDLDNFLKAYYYEMQILAKVGNIDVLTHLTYPLRYINGKYHRNIDIMRYIDEIKKILITIIKRNIALEINTSGITTPWDCFMPDENIIKLYKSLGGTLITIGSDAHISKNVGNGFKAASNMLFNCGFREYCYYKGRKPMFVKLFAD